MQDIELAEAFRLILNVRYRAAVNWPEDITSRDCFRQPAPERTPEDVHAPFKALEEFRLSIHLLEIRLYTREKILTPWIQIAEGDQQAGEPDFGGCLRLMDKSCWWSA